MHYAIAVFFETLIPTSDLCYAQKRSTQCGFACALKYLCRLSTNAAPLAYARLTGMGSWAKEVYRGRENLRIQQLCSSPLEYDYNFPNGQTGYLYFAGLCREPPRGDAAAINNVFDPPPDAYPEFGEHMPDY